MGKHIILERLGTILTPIKHLLDKLEANKVDRSELDEALESKVNKDELDEIISDTISSNPNIKNKMDKAGIKALLYTTPINKKRNVISPRVNSWEEVYHYINEVKHEKSSLNK